MDILLTGGTGLIGAAVLRRLLAEGHTVTAVVRSEESAAAVGTAGGDPIMGDLTDVDWLAGQLDEVDGALHTAAGGDAGDEALNAAVIEAALRALDGRPYVHTGGVWTYGSSAAIDEDDAPRPPAITAWRIAGEDRVRSAAGVRGSVVQPGIVYGYGQGIPGVVAGGPRDDQDRLVLVGSGEQHWTTVHVDDLADLYVRVLTDAPGGGAYVGASGDNPTVRELGEAVVAAPGSGLTGVVPGTEEEAAERLGGPFAEALLLDQQADGARARALGWSPSRPALVELLRAGYPADR